MTTDERWGKAQSYERGHWAQVATEMATQQGTLEWYEWRANTLRDKLRRYVPELDVEQAHVLEIGSGPVGTVSYLNAARRCAVDPLMEFYENNPPLLKWRNKAVEFLSSGGESLPFEDATFTLVIIENVIDHTKSPSQVLSEIRRVLRPEGVLYLTVNVHTNWGLLVRHAMEFFQLDKGHPHSYAPASARRLIRDMEFKALHEEMEDFKVARVKERQAGHLRNRVKLLLGVYDVLWEVIARRG